MIENIGVAFVILHYQNAEVTENCIASIKNVISETVRCQIVVVDNKSPNQSGAMLQEKYCHDEDITVIINDENWGFAKGNNIGYAYARDHLKADIIAVINSDVIIRDKQILQKLVCFSKENKDVSILAPDIVTPLEFHQNPYLKRYIPTEEQKIIILRKTIGQILYSIPVINVMILKKTSKKKSDWRKHKEENQLENIIPHGAAVIYLPEWTHNESFAFREGTFLFVEEEILYDYCHFNNKKIVYDPSFVIFHMEDASQNYVSVNHVKKKVNQIKYEIQSRKVLLKYRDELENRG